MARIERVRKSEAPALHRIPARLSPAVALLDGLREAGLVDAIGERCRIVRQGGYAGLDIALFLLVYFAAGADQGLKSFYRASVRWWKELAATADRAGLPSTAAVSRGLGNADADLLRPFQRWLLCEALDVGLLLRHPATQYADATGAPWHVFDYDPTCTALRQRSLERSQDLPEPRRKAALLGAAPGKTGRKRGEVVVHRSVLQHTGSGLWFDTQVEGGNGKTREQLASALGAVVQVCRVAGHAPDHALVRMDGQFGGVPSIAAAREHGVRFLTRWGHYGLLDTDEVRRALMRASWMLVPDSGSGPRRGAADAGWVLLEATVRRADGSTYAPERVRLIVSRYPTRGEAHRGRVVDGVCYELFVTDLEEEAWPAHEVVAAYFARGAEENRFAQEDRELGLDRVFAYDPAGQEMACVLGCFVWNWQIVQGFLAAPPTEALVQAQGPSRPEADERPLAVLRPVVSEPPPPPPPVATPAAPFSPPDAVARRAHLDAAREHVLSGLSRLLQGSRLEQRGWTLDGPRRALICPNGETFTWQGLASARGQGAARAAFNTRDNACARCTLDQPCRKPERSFNFQPTIAVPAGLAARVTTPPELRHMPPPGTAQPLLLPAAPTRGALAIRTPTFLPSEARKVSAEVTGAARHEIRAPHPSPTAPCHRLLAADTRRRRHARATHAVNLARYGLPADALVSVHSFIEPEYIDAVERSYRAFRPQTTAAK